MRGTEKKYIDISLIREIRKIKEDYEKKGIKISFVEASRILAKRKMRKEEELLDRLTFGRR